ncbi:Yippee/Mis18/Cereblon - like 9 [Theobroma cacao]|nr:Yippee/Mis18/Cereblon - like 9 [Theobroma cacao]
MGRIFVVELDGRSYRCKFCRTHLALPEDLASRFSMGNPRIAASDNLGNRTIQESPRLIPNPIIYGDVFPLSQGESLPLQQCMDALTCLVFRVSYFRVNITVGALEDRVMISGMHTVADIFCCCCGQIVGWKYEAAHEKSQKYKEGKFVLERGRIVDEIDFSSEVYIDTRPSMSDSEDA